MKGHEGALPSTDDATAEHVRVLAQGPLGPPKLVGHVRDKQGS